MLVPGGHVRITLSLGLTLYPQDGQGVDELVDRADAALSQAKGAGRNRVSLAA